MIASRVMSLLVIGLALAGIGIASYLTVVHYSHVALVCSSSGLVNCEQVLKSSYAAVFGIPWSVGGIVYFGVSGGLAATALVRRPEPRLLQPLQLAWSLLGLGVVIYLVGVEFVALDHICAWCSAMHGLIIATLLITLLRTPNTTETAGAERGVREAQVD